MDQVIESCRFVSARSLDVSIDRDALEAFCGSMMELSIPPWPFWCHFKGSDRDTATYVLLLDSVNFCFWPPKGKARWEIDVRGENFSGYFGLALSLTRAIERGIPLTDLQFLRDMSKELLSKILGGRGELQLMDERAAAIRESADIVTRLFRADPLLLIKEAQGSSVSLVELLAGNFPSFNDTGTFLGRKVFFYKRAQLLAADLEGAFGGSGFGYFKNMERLTAFADYKLPQVLRQLDILKYSDRLSCIIDSMHELQSGSREEIEIRANTITAVEMIRELLRTRGKSISSHGIDWILWNMGQSDNFRRRPYHRTACIYY